MHMYDLYKLRRIHRRAVVAAAVVVAVWYTRAPCLQYRGFSFFHYELTALELQRFAFEKLPDNCSATFGQLMDRLLDGLLDYISVIFVSGHKLV